MGDGAALLEAVLANPADDTPRLVYADWLQERDGELGTTGYFDRWYGRFIAASVKREPYPNDGIWGARLFGDHIISALRPFTWTLDDSGVTYQFLKSDNDPKLDRQLHVARGFVESVTCPAADWLTHADAICSQQPVTAVRLTSNFPPGAILSHDGEWWFASRL